MEVLENSKPTIKRDKEGLAPGGAATTPNDKTLRWTRELGAGRAVLSGYIEITKRNQSSAAQFLSFLVFFFFF